MLDIEFYYAAKGKMIRPPRPGIFAESCTFMVSSNTSNQYKMINDASIDQSVLRILASVRGLHLFNWRIKESVFGYSKALTN